MKIVYKQYNAVASWRWDVDPSGSSSGGGPSAQKDTLGNLAVEDDEEEDEDDEEDDEESDDEEEMCGVCQQEFESACPGCKTPGDDCPLTIMGPPSFVPANGTTISAPQVTPLDAEGEYNRSETHTIRPNGTDTDTDAAEAEHESTPPSIHTLSQAGDLPSLHALKQSGNLTEETVNSRDEQGVTALHWAAINNHVAVCRFLLELGAEIDPVGGELKATPLMWAAR
ncbi:hypothetical protein QFC21_001248 [Naganishia friedmannii]|uniref:Uncharacterized protein n=1 Tax=Naganishia friedmannii TaxID=89922 RepID=A0ACC2W5I8_9TREE|nr:hypothetical protein QFC21_001248 [Naganishia friedmannii]